MADIVARIDAVFASGTGLPEDSVQNSHHFLFDSADAAGQGAVVTAVKNFYDSFTAPGTAAVGTYLGPQLSRAVGGMHLKTYLADPAIGDFVLDADLTTTLGSAAGGAALPSEVSAVLSFSGYGVASNPAARRRERGRIYLGPLGDNTKSVLGSGQPVLTATFIANVEDALKKMAVAVHAVSWKFGVYSGTGLAFHQCDAGWMDNAFDTQRRRGEKPSTRNTFVLTTI